MHDRLRSRGIQVLGPLDHGFIQSIYFEGPEGLNLEVCTGSDTDEQAWIDPDVSALCGITDAELDALKNPARFRRPADPVPQPSEPYPDNARSAQYPERQRLIAAMSGAAVWEKFSETAPPVNVED